MRRRMLPLLVPRARKRGQFGPQPHPNFIEVFCQAAVGDGHRTVERAGKDAAGATLTLLTAGWGSGVATTPDDGTVARDEFDAGTGSHLALTATNPSRTAPRFYRDSR
jgi:hypothetical protein